MHNNVQCTHIFLPAFALPSNHQSRTTDGISGQLCLQLRHNRTHHQGYNIAGVCVYGILLNITCWASATTMPM